MLHDTDNLTTSLVKKLRAIVSLDANEARLLLVYAIVIGLLTLVIPITAQRLVTIVSFGTVIQPLFILGFILFILLFSSGITSILNAILVENIQQHIFGLSALKIAERLVYIRLDQLEEYRGTELVNRFFDVTTIQKNIGDLLLNGLGIIIQSILGLLLLAIYHPLLIVFDLVFIVLLIIVLWWPWKKALKFALLESDAKYALVAWLEEIARLPTLFRFQSYENFALERADDKVSAYLKARQSHFTNMLYHIGGTYCIQILASTSLLLLGGLLVMSNQMTLGQLVAAEIIVNTLGIAVTKFGRYLEKIYDLLASAEKVDVLLRIKTEISNHQEKEILAAFTTPPHIEVRNLYLPNSSRTSALSFTLIPGERALILGKKGTGKSFLIRSLLNFNQQNQEKIFYNNCALIEYNLQSLRKNIVFICGNQLFDGSILDNLCLNHKNISSFRIRQLLLDFQLDRLIDQLEAGLKTNLKGLHLQLSSVEKQKLMFVRAILTDPVLLVLDEVLDYFAENDLQIVLRQLLSSDRKWTVIATSCREEIGQYFQRNIFL